MTLDKFKILFNNFKKFENLKDSDPMLFKNLMQVFENIILKDYNNIGWEWVHWYIFDTNYGITPTNIDGPASVEELYNLLEKDYKH